MVESNESDAGSDARALGRDGAGHDEVQEKAHLWEYTVLITNAGYDITAIGQLYRDRCDCQNGVDELKNHWGWGGFSTQDMHRSQVTARAVALVYNWRSWYGQTALYLTPMHAEAGLIESMIANVQSGYPSSSSTPPARPGARQRRTILRRPGTSSWH